MNKNWQLPKFKITEFRKKHTKYCVCIPVINEGERIIKQLRRMAKYTKLIDIIILDGGSSDGSLEKNFLKKVKVRTMLIKLSPGKQSTQLRMGLAYALNEGYAGVIIMDGNGKDGVEQLPSFITSLDAGYDYIQGSRFIKGGRGINTPPVRWFGIRFIISPILSLAAKFWFTDITNGFRACSRKYLLNPKLNLFRDIFTKYELLFYLPVRAKQLNLKVTEIPVVRAYPKNEIPTKIKTLGGHLDLFYTVLKTGLGMYNPT